MKKTSQKWNYKHRMSVNTWMDTCLKRENLKMFKTLQNSGKIMIIKNYILV